VGIDPLKAVFLDRDGVLNANIFYADTGALESPRTVADFALLPTTLPALQALQRAGFLLFLVSNQPNVIKGKSTQPELDAIHARLQSLLEGAGISFAGYFYCFHHPDFGAPCDCRKPSPFFLLQAAAAHNLDLPHSWMIGDRLSDIVCGNRAGVRTILVADRVPDLLEAAEVPTATAPDLGAAVEALLASGLVG
jgi:D-glycero-D-manno-heptose 1,7-bisphosphate phosphatase